MSPETTFNPNSLTGLDRERLKSYKDNLDFYNGSQWQKSSRERQLVFNYAKVVCDKLTSYLLSNITFACDPVADQAAETARAAEQALRQVYEDNNLVQLDWETELDCAIMGDGCYKVTWDPARKTGSEASGQVPIKSGQVRITSPDVAGIFAWHTADDLSRLWRVASRYSLTADEAGELYGYKSLKKTVVLTEVWTEKQFILFLDDQVRENRANPYGFIPFIVFPNLRLPKQFWGESDIPPLMEAQRELNRALTQLSRIMELSGNPITVLENIQTAEGVQVQPGAVWTIPEDAKAYLLDLLQGGGVRLHIEFIDLLYKCLHDLSESPRAAYGGIERELSGVALEVELHSLLQKVRRKRTIRTGVYKRRNEMILALLEKFTGRKFTDIHQRINWGPVIPQDKARQAQNEQLLVQAGVHSRRRAMDEIGIEDPEGEFQQWLEERKVILQMNQEFRARSSRGGPRERATAAETEGLEQQSAFSIQQSEADS